MKFTILALAIATTSAIFHNKDFDKFGIKDYVYRTIHNPVWRILKIDDILESKDCWVIFNGEESGTYEGMQDYALKYMGSVMFGFLADMNTATLAKGKVLDFKEHVAFVFPYGDKDTKLDTLTPYIDMETVVAKHLPPLPAEIDYNPEAFKTNFIHKAHKHVPEKIPVIINVKEYTDDHEGYHEKTFTGLDHKGKERSLVALALIRVFADIFQDHFSFTLAYQEDSEKLIKLTDIVDLEYPEMFVPIGDPKDGFKLSFERHWESSTKFVMEPLMDFIVKCADVTRIKLHGNHKNDDDEVRYMKKTADYFKSRIPNNWKGYEHEQWEVEHSEL